jgi:hypothetical protein
MTVTKTYPHGVKLTTTTHGYDLHRGGRLAGRVSIRRSFDGRQWTADIFAHDGYTWTLDRRTVPGTMPATRAAIDAYAAAYDQFAYVASGECHR